MASNWSQDIYIKAYRFAAEAHNGQLFPGTQLPYIMHVSFVAVEVIAALGVHSGLNGNLAVQCALLHDTLEDTKATYNELSEEFGAKVAKGVKALTKDLSIGVNISEKWRRKKLQMDDSLKRIRKQRNEIWMVKLADRITNLQPPPSHWDQEKILRYKQEAKLIYDNLKDADKFLADRLKQKIGNYNLDKGT